MIRAQVYVAHFCFLLQTCTKKKKNVGTYKHYGHLTDTDIMKIWNPSSFVKDRIYFIESCKYFWHNPYSIFCAIEYKISSLCQRVNYFYVDNA